MRYFINLFHIESLLRGQQSETFMLLQMGFNVNSLRRKIAKIEKGAILGKHRQLKSAIIFACKLFENLILAKSTGKD